MLFCLLRRILVTPVDRPGSRTFFPKHRYLDPFYCFVPFVSVNDQDISSIECLSSRLLPRTQTSSPFQGRNQASSPGILRIDMLSRTQTEDGEAIPFSIPEKWRASFEATAFPPPPRKSGSDHMEHILVLRRGRLSEVIASNLQMPLVMLHMPYHQEQADCSRALYIRFVGRVSS